MSSVPEITPRERLVIAVHQGDIGGVRAAMAEGAEPTVRHLFKAAECHQNLVFRYLLDCGVKADRNELLRDIAFLEGENLEALDMLLADAPLALAVKAFFDTRVRRPAAAKHLIDHVAATQPEALETVLAQAIRRHSPRAVEMLVSAGVDPRANNRQAFDWASDAISQADDAARSETPPRPEFEEYPPQRGARRVLKCLRQAEKRLNREEAGGPLWRRWLGVKF